MAEKLIVVGVDGSDESREALRWAVAEARLRHGTVEVVHAYWALPMLSGETEDAEEPESALHRFVLETVGSDPGVTLTTSLVQGRQASAVLIDAAHGADLLVVGSRGSGGFAGLLLGSVAHQCALHAPCPIVIVCAKGSRG